MKDFSELFCKSFCSGLEISEIGNKDYAVSTPFEMTSGDRISFYILDNGDGLYRIEDEGFVIPSLLASGVNIKDGTRKRELDRILNLHGIFLNEDTNELVSGAIQYEQLPEMAFKFIDVLLKMDALKTPFKQENVAGMFRDDVLKQAHKTFDGVAKIYEGEEIDKKISEFAPDFVIQKDSQVPVVVYLAVSDQKIWEAVALKSIAKNDLNYPCQVMTVIDRVGTKMISKRSLVAATNRLNAASYFYDDQIGAMQKMQEAVNYGQRTTH